MMVLFNRQFRYQEFYEINLIDGGKAFTGEFENNPSWRNTIEACGLTAGLVGGIGGEKCRTAADMLFIMQYSNNYSKQIPSW